MHLPSQNPAFTTNATEFKRVGNAVVAITNGTERPFSETSAFNKMAIGSQLAAMPVLRKGIKGLAVLNGVSEEEQFAYCILGGEDKVADISEDGKVQMNEPISCPKLATCPHADGICLQLKATQTNLSKGQLRVLAHFPLSAGEIANKLNRSIQTIYQHEKDIKKKIGYGTREGLTYYASKVGII